ncbi:hypothetical protein JANAI62_37450 [Jannaschia pagri]|uniref:Uncharacterized protein n=1 Tax=Jannaschia pagri TaxID=2829797 RepID=A0ABQ4NSM2_9RHOB|nr:MULTISPECIES: hypothetical protein [unclassified Jannaschia]GIT93348.1 hypothetical protein JANAI61_38060 [Jannaschia sp. AI_61]GIT97122.1 hypothetical protein JANAI62_37450 [Jannaschia sp. AI_62]
MYWIKFAICVFYDLFDMTAGRLLFATPFAGEIVGVLLACSLFGTKGIWYAVEAIDPTEQLDGFVPTATLIALAYRRAELEEREMLEGPRP